MKINFHSFLVFVIMSIFISLNAQDKNLSSEKTEISSRTEFDKIMHRKIDSSVEMQKLIELKSKLTESQKKLSTDLLQLIDQKLLPSTTDLQTQVNSMIKLNQIKLFEGGNSLREQVSESSVYVYIFLFEGISTYSFDEYASVITDRDEKNHIAVAWIQVKNLENIASLNEVRSIRTVYPPINRTGSVNTEGDDLHRTSNVRSFYGEDGTGINVGIISDGVTTRSAAQSTGDLPSDGSGLNVLSAGSGDEGTAMLEIVHDMAPGANLFFHDAGMNTVAFNTAIDNLVAAGCDIICDDVGWITQPFFEDGTIASHVTSAINANDIIYISSCGNAGNSHYQGDYFPITASTQHDFSLGGSSGFYLYLNLDPFENVIIVLQWNDQFGASGNDYDLLLFNLTTGNQVTQSWAVQDGDDDPLEVFSYTAPAGNSDDYAIVVDNFQGAAQTRNLEVFIYPGSGASIYTNNINPSDAIFGHPAVDEAVSVAAADWATPTVVESFSSNGPSTISFPSSTLRQTPKITGVDGVSVTGAGGFPSSFFGTSAAAPHIAGILAQAWSYDLGQAGDDVRQLLYDFAIDIGAGNFDYVYGYGRADALDLFVGGGLPVELSSFSALIIDKSIKLNWKTATEVDNYGFEIERSVKSSTWQNIGFVEGNGNSNSPKEYSFEDSKVSAGTYYYRLKQIDNDGTFEYSNQIDVNFSSPQKFELTQNYPNPFNPHTNIQFTLPNDANVKLKILNVLGESASILVDEQLTTGVHHYEFNASKLPSGIYFYAIEVDGKILSTKKMILLK
jgi:hypothetical protein